MIQFAAVVTIMRNISRYFEPHTRTRARAYAHMHREREREKKSSNDLIFKYEFNLIQKRKDCAQNQFFLAFKIQNLNSCLLFYCANSHRNEYKKRYTFFKFLAFKGSRTPNNHRL
ncbi:hypothetical protein AAHE18_17G238000 [Arachis hypogaea]